MYKRLIAAVFITAIAATALSAFAADHPERSIKIVAPYAPGGAVDVVAREVARKLTGQMHQSFFVENKPGAAGTIGMRQVQDTGKGFDR